MRVSLLLGLAVPSAMAVALNGGVVVGVGAGAVSPDVYPTPQARGSGAWKTPYARARALVAQMTLDERVNITRGFPDRSNTCAGNTGSVPRLGWQGLCLMDAGNGVRATDMVSGWASGLHVGAAWDRNLTYERGFWMGREFRAKG
ncbi:glycoside hydrolase 3, partial [Claviceps lovelessii]